VRIGAIILPNQLLADSPLPSIASAFHLVEHRLASFGPYEDPISKEHGVLFHSVPSPLLNTGLLTPGEVVNHAVEHSQRQGLGLASLEGFVRQVIGWREFMRAYM
jgi:deoxyribodipyrimidine photolyase-related protein